MFQACFMTSKIGSSSAKTIVVSSGLKSTLRKSFLLSASSRRPEDVKMLRVALPTERDRMLRILFITTTNYSFSLFFIKNAFISNAASPNLTRRRS